MHAALYAALVFTVALLVTTAYFLMGSLPLLILQHDTPLDARFIRGFFNTYFWAAMVTAAGTAASYALAARPAYAVGAAAIAGLSAFFRAKVIGRMDALRGRMAAAADARDAADAIPGFRRTHLAAIAINLVQLVVVVWSLTTLSL